MQIIELSDVSYAPAGHALLRGLDWQVRTGQRIGLIGPNGAGKSSLLALLAGAVAPDAGDVRRRREASVGWLTQDVDFAPGATLAEAALRPPPALAAVERELDAIARRLADPGVYGDEGRLARALARQERALARFEALGGPSFEGRGRALLAHFGFAADDGERPLATLSGGEKRLVALTALALQQPDLLLLDEPDNHLDLAAKARLEAFVRDYPGAVVIVSHDRYLLDACVDTIAEVEGGGLYTFRGTYTEYVAHRERERLEQQRAHAAQRVEIERIEASIRRFERWASLVVNERHSRQARSRRRALARMEERGEIVEAVREARRLDLALPGSRGSRRALALDGVSMGFGDALVFVGVDLLVRHGERVGLVGRNGCGKSVLMKLVAGEHRPLEGEVRIGPSTRVGYYAQEHDTLRGGQLDRSPLEWIRDVAPMTEDAAVALLLRYLFRYDQVRQPIGTLSGGERSRLQLARLVLERPNLLLLDEPTNHLDIPAAEVLEAALDDFEGSLLVVSHDRYFLDRTVDRVVELRDGALETFDGGYSDWLDAKTAEG